MTQNLTVASDRSLRDPECAQYRRPAQVVLAMLLIVTVGAAAACVTPLTAHAFDFAKQAIADAGDHPSVQESRKIEALLRLRAYANAVLSGVFMGTLISGLFRLQVFFQRGFADSSPMHVALTLSRAAIIGGSAVGLACLAYRLQEVGRENLQVAALIFSAMWGALGATPTNASDWKVSGKWKLPLPVIGGLAWGLLFPAIMVVVRPNSYFEGLFATDHLVIAVWAGAGSAVVLSLATLFPVPVKHGPPVATSNEQGVGTA